MQAIVDLPDSLYRRGEALAASRGASVEEFIVEAVAKEVAAKEVQGTLESANPRANGGREVELPVIRSGRPGTMDLTDFDFDDLLA